MNFDDVMKLHIERNARVRVRELTMTVNDDYVANHADGGVAEVDFVNVISRTTGGSVRTYVGIGDVLLLALPAYPSEWQELDDWVAKKLGVNVIAK